jgi:uncharacterized protein (DUF302 family)
VTSDETPGVVTRRAAGDAEQLLRRTVALIDELGLDVFSVIDHSGDADDAGLSMPTTKLVLFGSTEAATQRPAA